MQIFWKYIRVPLNGLFRWRVSILFFFVFSPCERFLPQCIAWLFFRFQTRVNFFDDNFHIKCVQTQRSKRKAKKEKITPNTQQIQYSHFLSFQFFSAVFIFCAVAYRRKTWYAVHHLMLLFNIVSWRML